MKIKWMRRKGRENENGERRKLEREDGSIVIVREKTKIK